MKKILLAEDEMLLATVVQATLEVNGYLVEHVSDGAAALGVLQTGPLPDLVLTDLMMPRMGGDELIARIRSSETTRHLPVILMSAAARETVEQKNVAADLFVGKPFHARSLVRAVDDLLKGRTDGA
ncbi:MAG: response regulator [Caenispirillum sp.]|nr:response regulator [Caenispirillum sp.]